MKYHVVFDIAQSGFQYWYLPLLPLLIAGCLVVLLLRTSRSGQQGHWHLRFLFMLGVVLSVFLGIFPLYTMYREYAYLKNALLTGHFTVIEGKVERCIATPGGAMYFEDSHMTFWVGGRQFHYSTRQLTSAYHGNRGRMDPIAANRKVRITEINGKIARLEIAE